MASRYEVEITIESATNLKNVNWRYGPLKPYAVIWIDDGPKCTTKVDLDNDENPIWEEKLTVPLPPSSRLDEAKLFVDVVHANPTEGVKPLVGSAKLHLREVLDEAGMGGKVIRSLKLKRPSGRPHGKLEVKVAIKEPRRYYDDQYAPPYGQTASREYGQQYGGGYNQYTAPPPPSNYSAYPAAAPPSGYPYGGPPPQTAYGSGSFGAPAPTYGSGSYGGAPAYGSGSYGSDPYAYGAPAQPVEQKKSKFGMGTGLAVGAAAGLVGGLALGEGIDYVEDKIEDNVADKVEDDLAYDDDDGGDW